jgi:hypothetical protein
VDRARWRIARLALNPQEAAVPGSCSSNCRRPRSPSRPSFPLPEGAAVDQSAAGWLPRIAGNCLYSQAPMKCQITRSLTPRFACGCLKPLSRGPARGLHQILLFTLFAACCWSQSLAIKRVTVIDATGRGPEPNMTVIADGDRIVAVGPRRRTRIPRKAVIIDGTGKFLIPGLWDMHVHGASDVRAPWSHLLFPG